VDVVLSGLLAGMRRVRVTASYAAIVSTITVVMVRMDPAAQNALIRHASTNLHNLGRGRLGTLIGSAFVVDAGPIYLWLPGLICLLLSAELLWGGGRLVVTFVTGHIGATLLVAAGLATAVEMGWLSAAVTRASDVGMSYGAMAVVGVLTAAIPVRWRAAWLGFWFAAAAVVLLDGASFTDVGHVVALILGIGVSLRLGEPRQWSTPTVLLLVVGASFGFLMLADGLISLLLGVIWGSAGAVLAGIGARALRRRKRQQNASAEAAIQSERQDCGGSSRSSPGTSHS
jgi:hypothetical protein